ncbi:hypothetical protein CR513_16457, partial [Mucuna pruriens]
MHLEAERSHQGRSRLRKHPFVDGTVETPLPTGWKNLTLDKYDDTIDPNKHINAYEEDESLCYFKECVLAVAIKIRDLNPKVALDSMIMALKFELVSNSLCKKPPTSMDELRAKASSYIQMEEMTKY